MAIKHLLKTNAICESCGKLYYRERVNQKFCCYECSKLGQSFYQNREEKEKICVICGKIFLTFKKHQKYCSTECYKKANRAYHNSQLSLRHGFASVPCRLDDLKRR